MASKKRPTQAGQVAQAPVEEAKPAAPAAAAVDPSTEASTSSSGSRVLLALVLIPLTAFGQSLITLTGKPILNAIPLLQYSRWAGMLLWFLYISFETERQADSFGFHFWWTSVSSAVFMVAARYLAGVWAELFGIGWGAVVWCTMASAAPVMAIASVLIAPGTSTESKVLLSLLWTAVIHVGEDLSRGFMRGGAVPTVSADPEQALLVVAAVYGLLALFVDTPRRSLQRTASTLAINLVFLLAAAAYLTAGRDWLRSRNPSLRIIESKQSISGRVVVADWDHPRGLTLRFVRSDHSIIGGVWVRYTDEAKVNVDWGDSMFAAFPLQEVGLLVQRDTALSTLPTAEKERALVIGLGVGIGATYLSLRGLAVDAVEFDPAVYSAAIDYFPLGRVPPATHAIMDGAQYVRDAALARRTDPTLQKWSYVVQDCFSAGGVPVNLFTAQFWTDVADILDPERGVVVVNFAGQIQSKAARIVLRTLLHVFPECRAFGDEFRIQDAAAGITGNMVVVCAPRADAVLTFRAHEYADTLGSPLRDRVYSQFLDKEIPLDAVLHDEDWEDKSMILQYGGRLSYWKDAEASWGAIDKMFPRDIWMAY